MRQKKRDWILRDNHHVDDIIIFVMAHSCWLHLTMGMGKLSIKLYLASVAGMIPFLIRVYTEKGRYLDEFCSFIGMWICYSFHVLVDSPCNPNKWTCCHTWSQFSSGSFNEIVTQYTTNQFDFIRPKEKKSIDFILFIVTYLVSRIRFEELTET